MTKEQAQAVVRLSGVVEGGAYRKIGRGTWEARQVRERSRHSWGIHNARMEPGRESDRSKVVRKRGNACGAKGPDWGQVAVDTKGEPLERKFHYGKKGRGTSYSRVGEADSIAEETLSTEAETEPKGEAGAEVPILRVV